MFGFLLRANRKLGESPAPEAAEARIEISRLAILLATIATDDAQAALDAADCAASDCANAEIAIRRARNEIIRAEGFAANGDHELAVHRARLAWNRAEEARTALASPPAPIVQPRTALLV